MIPGAQKKTFVFNLRRGQYEKEFGADYEKPHGFARFLGFMYRLIPKIGPFRAFSFSVPTPEAERLFLESFTATRERFWQSLDALSAAHLHLVNTDFDTGQPTKRGEYSLADDTYDELLGKLADRAFANVSERLAVEPRGLLRRRRLAPRRHRRRAEAVAEDPATAGTAVGRAEALSRGPPPTVSSNGEDISDRNPRRE